MHPQLKTYADIITGEHSSFGDIKSAVDDLHRLLVSLGGVNAYTQTNRGTQSPTGEAVSTVTAALCAFDLARTRKFTRGLIAALREKTGTIGPVQVLYAGSGPYALLAILSIPYFSPDQVQFTAMDIHEESVSSVKVIIDSLSIKEYFSGIVLADATNYTWDKTKELHMLLTETMQNGLRNEQQVSIAARLAPMLTPGGIMVPAEIAIHPVLVDLKIRQDLMMGLSEKDPVIIKYDPIAVLDLQSAAAAAKNLENPFPETILLFDKEIPPGCDLELHTKITVWEDEVLAGFDSSLSLPVQVSSTAALEGYKGIRFNYENGAKPGFRWKLL